MDKKTVFSDDQKKAIKTRDRTLLVSAAAGSGKTTTLTERIIRSLLDGENPESISRMLIVTFTNASVLDLKEKISKALTKAYLENPESTRLADELRLLDSAKIMTIDSFCTELIRTNAERLGISPLYRIADGAEALILERSVMETLIEGAFSGGFSDELSVSTFESVCDALTGVKNTASLADTLISLYDKTKSMVKGTDVFFDFANDYLQYADKKLEETPYGEYIIAEARATLMHFPSLLRGYTKALYESKDDQLIAQAHDLEAICERLRSLAFLNMTYEDMQEKIGAFSFPKAPSVSNPKPEAAKAAINYRQSVKDALTSLSKNLLSYTREEWQGLFSKMGKAVGALAIFLDKFSKTYFAEKKKRGILEFSDVERLAYNVLWQDGKISEVAHEYRDLFTSVYIDEYQDVNEIQNKIFEAVSPEKKRFMVGDIKQSIYGFRSARPEIFAEMKKTFPPLSEDNYTETASIFMSENYRCDKGIIDFVNGVFDKLFGAVADSIGFVSADRLIYKKNYDFTPEYEKAEICIIEDGEDESADAEDGDSEYETSPISEAELVADKIKELIEKGKRRDGSPITPSDIAIIMRRKKHFALYRDALLKRGIRAEAPEDKDFFLNKEILLTLSLLNSIDNPRRDIYLAALMSSPLYSFTPDEIFIMRREGNGETLYDSLISYRENHPECEKLKAFLEALSHFRLLCEGMSVDTLLVRLYRETGLLALASKQGGSENLYKLYSYARKFEGSQYKGLYNFITFINNLIERGAQIDKNESNGKEEGTVSIGTIHSSKGLEYPVLFVSETASLLKNLDKNNKIAFAEDFGIAFSLRAPLGLALVENPVQKVIFSYMDKKFYEEAIRLLYVALTRAKEKLFITGKINGTAETYLKKMKALTPALSSYSVKKMKSYLDMICASGADANVSVYSVTAETEAERLQIKSEEKYCEEEIEALAKTLSERFSFVYPDGHLTEMPEKMSVSRLYPTVLDGTEADGEDIFEGRKEKSEPIPSFISPDKQRESAKRGIATHNFLQFFDIENLKNSGADAELERLKAKGFLSEKTAALVRREELTLFAKSELFNSMQSAKNLYREFRFNTKLPAFLFTSDEEKKEKYKGHYVLVQGVIDCLIENEDGSLRLIDYKTDRLTKEELADEKLAAKKLSVAHSLQLSYYALAVEKIFGKKPEKTEVYSLPLGKTVSV